MGWFGRHKEPAPEPLPWRATKARLQLVTPRHAGHAMRVTTSVQVDGREVLSCVPEGTAHVDAGGQPAPAAIEHPLVTRITEPLPLLAICDDLFAPASRLVPAPVVPVPGAPVDDDPYDGRAWKVRSAQPDFAQTLFNEPLWEALTAAARETKVLCWIDGDRLCMVCGFPRDVARATSCASPGPSTSA